MEALGQYKLIPGSRLRYLVENVLFVIEERAELDIKKETKATISTKRKKTSKSESARKKPKTNKSSIEREVQATKQEYTKSIPGKEKPTKYDKSHPLYHPPMHPVQHFQDEETDNFDTEDTAVVDDRKLTANQSLLPNINETGELERPTPNHEVARTSKSSTSKKKRKQSIPVRRPSIPDQQLLEVLPSVAPISPSRKDDNPVFAHLDRLEARFEQGRRMLEQGRQLFEQGMQIYDASLDEIRDLRETIQKDEEEREAKLDVINKLMRQL